MDAATATPNPAPPPNASPFWSTQRIVVGLALMALSIWAGLAAWADIIFIAMHDEEASQVWLVLPIAGWMIWSRRETVENLPPRYSAFGPLLIAVGWAVSMYGFFELKQALWHGGVVICLIGAAATVVGSRIMWRLLPVIVVMAFLVPVPAMIRQRIAIPMQTWTASASEFAFNLLALPVSRSGNVLTYMGQDIAVAEACNGMRMIFALLLVSYAFVFVTPLRPAVRALILILSPLAAIGCNVVRLVPTVYLYGVSPEKWGPTFHDLSGWAMLAVAFLLLMGTVRLLQWAEVPVMQPRPSTLVPPAAA